MLLVHSFQRKNIIGGKILNKWTTKLWVSSVSYVSLALRSGHYRATACSRETCKYQILWRDSKSLRGNLSRCMLIISGLFELLRQIHGYQMFLSNRNTCPNYILIEKVRFFSWILSNNLNIWQIPESAVDRVYDKSQVISIMQIFLRMNVQSSSTAFSELLNLRGNDPSTDWTLWWSFQLKWLHIFYLIISKGILLSL